MCPVSGNSLQQLDPIVILSLSGTEWNQLQTQVFLPRKPKYNLKKKKMMATYVMKEIRCVKRMKRFKTSVIVKETSLRARDAFSNGTSGSFLS